MGKQCRWSTLEEAASGLAALARDTDAAEIRFVEACIELEDSDLWQTCKVRDATFGIFLEKIGVHAAEYYERRARALRDAQLNALARDVGLSAAAVAAEIAAGPERDGCVQGIRAASADKIAKGQGGIVSERTARRERQRVAPSRVRISKEDQQAARIEELQAELRTMTRRALAAEREAAELRERLSAAENQAAENSRDPKGGKAVKSHRSQPRA